MDSAQTVGDPEAEDEYPEGDSDDVYSESEYLEDSAAKVQLEDGVDLRDW